MQLKSDRIKSEGSYMRWTPFEGGSSLPAGAIAGVWEIRLCGGILVWVGI